MAPLKLREFVCEQDELQELLETWQPRLRLADWKIRARIVRQSEIEQPGSQAQVWANHHLRFAEVKILDPIDYEGGEDWPQDMESSLVHELVHLVFWFLPEVDHDEEPYRYSLEEQAIEAIADALIESGGAKAPAKTKSKTKRRS